MVEQDKGGNVSNAKARELRTSQHSSHVTPYPEEVEEDGSIRDEPARKFAAQQMAVSSQAPNERVPADDSVGTPQWHEENSPDDMHSDGGPTLARDLGDKSVLSLLDGYKDDARSEEDVKTPEDREADKKKADADKKKSDRQAERQADRQDAARPDQKQNDK